MRPRERTGWWRDRLRRLALSIRDRGRPSWSPDEAEGVTGRVGVDVLAVELHRAQRQDVRAGSGHVLDHDVEVDLLGHAGVRPGRRTVVGGELEREARG